jgi:ankyrin repeat protein
MGKMSYRNKKQLSQSLVEAAKRDDVDLMKMLLKKGADVHFDDDEALFAAAWRGRESAVRFLIDHGASPAARRSAGAIAAAQFGHRNIVHVLVKRGANAEALTLLELRKHGIDKRKSCWSDIVQAASDGRLDAVKALLKHHPAALASTDFATLVVEAALNNYGHVVSCVLKSAGSKRLKRSNAPKPIKRRFASLESELRITRMENNNIRVQNQILRDALDKLVMMFRQQAVNAKTAVAGGDPAIKKALKTFAKELKP